LQNKESVAKLLSQNDNLHTYNEQPSELLTNLIWDFVDNLRDGMEFEEAHYKLYNDHSKKNSRFSAILSSAPLLRMFVHTWKLSDYYPSTILFKPTWLRNNLIKDSAAVSILIF
jgi:hypothetical protein